MVHRCRGGRERGVTRVALGPPWQCPCSDLKQSVFCPCGILTKRLRESDDGSCLVLSRVVGQQGVLVMTMYRVSSPRKNALPPSKEGVRVVGDSAHTGVGCR